MRARWNPFPNFDGGGTNGTFARSGIATVWVIVSLPVVILLFVVVVELANLWLARAELEHALEAGASAGVKTWAELSEDDAHAAPNDETKTNAAREAARAAAAANNVRGQSVQLGLNDDADTDADADHNNASCDGDIILGGADKTTFTFNELADVGCGRSEEVEEEIFVTVELFVQTADTSADSSSFFISLDDTAGEDPFTGSITQIRVNLRNPASDFGIDDGVFDPFSGTGTPGEMNGFGPVLGAGNEVSGVTFDTSQASSGILDINIPAGNFTTDSSSNDLVFGIDTDDVDDPSPFDPRDDGNDFGDPGAASATPGRILFQIAPAGASLSEGFRIESLQPQGPDNMDNSRAVLQGNALNLQGTLTILIIIPDQDFAVLTQKTVPVESFSKSLFGVPIGPFDVSAQAIALSRCRENTLMDPVVLNPEFVHINIVNCTD